MHMEATSRVLTEATIVNLYDIFAAEHGLIRADQVRRAVVLDAVVNDDVMMLHLPSSLIQRMGLAAIGLRRYGDGGMAYAPVQLTIMGRDCRMDVLEAPNDSPVVIGKTVLLALDWVIDARQRKLIGNPAHGGEWMYELY